MATGSALGAKLEYAEIASGSGSAGDPYIYGDFTELVNLGAFDFPFGTFAKLDTTVHASAKKRFAPGIKDGGIVSVPIVWNDAEDSHQWVEDHLHEKHVFQYTPKDGDPVIFIAILKSLSTANPVGTGPKERTLMLRRSGGTANAAP